VLDAYRRADGESKRAEHLGHRHIAALQSTERIKFTHLRGYASATYYQYGGGERRVVLGREAGYGGAGETGGHGSRRRSGSVTSERGLPRGSALSAGCIDG
jgi:hypothetical protein